MRLSQKSTATIETDYLIVGAGAMGIAFADEIFSLNPTAKLTIIDRRARAGGHWNDAYPFVRLHQPAAFYGVNSLQLGNGSADLSSKPELLTYFDKVIAKFKASGRVEFLPEHEYVGDGNVVNLNESHSVKSFKINKRLVDASYMKVEVPSTHAPKYQVNSDVKILPINALPEEYEKWDKFYVVGNGKTGMDAVLFLLEKKISPERIFWICPNQAWLFNREQLQVGMVGKEVLMHAEYIKKVNNVEDIFLSMEKTGGIIRIDESTLPKKWRCATVSPEELLQLRTVKNVIQKGRVKSISLEKIELEQGTVPYYGKTLFVDCSANALSKRKKTKIFSDKKITLQSILFCQQVFSAAAIARLELKDLRDEHRNKISPVPHPELATDWPNALSVSIGNLLVAHRYFPLWMYRSRLNFMSHEPFLKYFGYAAKAMFLSPGLSKAAFKLTKTTD